MNIQHYEKGFHYTDRELLHIAQKIGKLATFCKRLKNDDSYIRIEAEHRRTEKKRDSFKVMVTVALPDKVLRAESRKDNPIDAVDSCTEKLDTQVKKYKDMHTRKGKAQKARKTKGGKK